MCWVATGAESVYNLSPTGFEIYLYQTDGEVRDPRIAHLSDHVSGSEVCVSLHEGLNRDNAVNWNYELHYEITGNC